MARRKTTRRKTGTTATKRRTTKRRTARKKGSGTLANFFVPLFFICCILGCLGFLLFMGYQTVTASSFFEVEKIETVGVKNLPKDEIKKIVETHTRMNGVWNADIDAIKSEVENFKYSRNVSVSRVLPDTVRVIVQERKPVALVRLNGKDYWVDKDGLVLDKVSAEDDRPPFTMFGWSESNTGNDIEVNKERVQLYLKLLQEWKSNNLAKRVKAVDLADLRDPQAIVEDTGHTVRIILSKDADVGELLKEGIENIAGRGREIKSIDMSATNPIVRYRIPKS